MALEPGIHPRLYINVDTLAALQTKATGTHAQYYDAVVAEGTALLSADPLSFHQRWPERVASLCLPWLVEGETPRTQAMAAKAHAVALELLNCIESTDRDAVRDIMQVAVVYDWLYSYLSPAARQVLRSGLLSKMTKRIGNVQDVERFGWGQSADNAIAIAAGCWSIIEDVAVPNDSTVRAYLANVDDWIDNGSQDCLLGTLRTFESGTAGGIPFGSGGHDVLLLGWLVRYVEFSKSAFATDHTGDAWYATWMRWLIWHYVAGGRAHREHEAAGASACDECQAMYALRAAAILTGDDAGNAQWLLQQYEAAGTGAPALWSLLHRDLAQQALAPTVAQLGAVAFFTQARKLVMRDGWGPGDVSLAVSLPQHHTGGGQYRCAGDFSLFAEGVQLVGRSGFERAAAPSTYYRSAAEGDAGGRYSYAHRILAGSMPSVYDDELHLIAPQDIAQVRAGRNTGIGYLEQGATSEHFPANVTDAGTYFYSNCGGQRRPKPADYKTRAAPTGEQPGDIAEMLADYGIPAPTARNLVEGESFTHYAVDITQWYALPYNSAFEPLTHYVRRHFYFIKRGAIDGWPHAVFFVLDEISAPNSTQGKLTKRTWVQLPSSPTNKGTGTGPLARMSADDAGAGTPKAAQLFIDVLLPASAEKVITTGPEDLLGKSYTQPASSPADAWGGATSLARLEINPPDTAEAVRFLLVYYPCAADVADAPPATLIDDVNNVGVRVGYPGSERDYVIPKDGSDPAEPAAAGDTTAPAVPTGVAATPGTNKVDVSWDANAESDLASYIVSRRRKQ